MKSKKKTKATLEHRFNGCYMLFHFICHAHEYGFDFSCDF